MSVEIDILNIITSVPVIMRLMLCYCTALCTLVSDPHILPVKHPFTSHMQVDASGILSLHAFQITMLYMQVVQAPNKRARKAARRALQAKQAATDTFTGPHKMHTNHTPDKTIGIYKHVATHASSTGSSKVRSTWPCFCLVSRAVTVPLACCSLTVGFCSGFL